MEVCQFAKALIEATTVEEKLARPPTNLTDNAPGEAVRLSAPARPENLQISAERVKVPPVTGMGDKSQRVRILNALANHELQAAELFAWALLAFPDSPAAFRRGLLSILAEEQLHCELYIERMNALGREFGDFPVTAHFWNVLGSIKTPLEFITGMGLTLESANLDFSGDYAVAAREAGDFDTALAIEQVHRDEVGHVAFAWRWLEKMRPADETPWQTYLRTVPTPLGPDRARGKNFDRASRVRTGMSESFIDAQELAIARRPNGRPR